jgi:phage gp37-like protein
MAIANDNPVTGALSLAIEALESRTSEPGVGDVLNRLQALYDAHAGGADTADDDSVEGQFAKSMQDMEVLSKSETARPEMRQRAARLHRRMQAQHLLRVNPSAAAEWAELHAA